MKLYAPKYYKDFACVADRCRHSCCIGWEIDVDADSMERYQSIKSGYGTRIPDSIDRSTSQPYFRLAEGKRCPHLNDDGLCNIILNCGEDYLCNICREHPRFYHDTACGKEVGVGMACEEACRLILSSDSYDLFDEIEELDEVRELSDTENLELRMVLNSRDHILSVLKNSSKTLAEKLEFLEKDYYCSPKPVPDYEWVDCLCNEMEFLDPSHRELMSAFRSDAPIPPSLDLPLTRAMAYFVYRQASPAEDLIEFSAALGFAVICVRLLAALADQKGLQTVEELAEYARIISEELEYSDENLYTIKEVFYDLIVS